MNGDDLPWLPGREAAGMASRLIREADEVSLREPLLGRMCRNLVWDHHAQLPALSQILARVLRERFSGHDIADVAFEELIAYAHAVTIAISDWAALDIEAVLQRDPASESALSVVLYQKGFQALQLHRVAHVLWDEGRKDLALYLQSLCSRVLGVDIHPASHLGHGLMLDHGTGIVIGETCVVGNGVSLMQGVTLGGTGKSKGDRHPKLGEGVLVGAGAILLGNICVGSSAKIGAGSVVLVDVEAHTTVAGVPSQVVGFSSKKDMN